ncbi:MAG: hypothetical protein ACRD2X_13260 [Vicinamibacteraceae bacterium]
MAKRTKAVSTTSEEKDGPTVSLEETVYALEQAARSLETLLPRHTNPLHRLKIRTTRAELRGFAKILRSKCYRFP